MASVNIHCPRCQSAQVYRHGQNWVMPLISWALTPSSGL
ncbi:Transposase [Shigella dysenteriae 1617]|uniref:Transposase n=1 Tax=Shigella dysenteriae 1617 TaxID=754093 RepID=A0A0A6ZYL1_SHIDY|nr:Transposase [Shigella dysenteriae 1617]